MSDANNLTKLIELAISKEFPDVRLWRVNTGVWAPWELVRQALALLTARKYDSAASILKRCRPIRSGINGQADLTGFASVVIAGRRVGIRLEIEVKTGNDKLGEDQIRFRNVVQSLGVIYIEARSVEQCVRELRERLC